MPFLSKVGGGSARRFGFSRRSIIYTCNTNTSMVTFNPSDRKCYYPADYVATNNRTCPSGGTLSGTNCVYPANYGATGTSVNSGPGCWSGGVESGNACFHCQSGWNGR